VSVGEIEQAIENATAVRRNKRGRSGEVRIDSVTDGGRHVVVITVHNPARRFPAADHCVGGVMSRRTRRTEPEREAEIAERYYERRHEDGDWDEPERLDKPVRLDVTLSVRFSREELEAVRTAAEQAGIRPTAFIRQAAVEAVSRRPVDRARLQHDLAKAVELMEDAQRSLAS
jgi:hypothetical protein